MNTMEITIQENILQYMQELKAWLDETADCTPEGMSAFFTKRLSGYEAHMSVWSDAYRQFPSFLPENCHHILDLGCGTGLELDEIYHAFPSISVTGVDLCKDMLDRCILKHSNRNFKPIQADYLTYDMGTDCWDAVISFESLHHFLPAQKQNLYKKVRRSLKEKAPFIYVDYFACCEEEEELLRSTYFEKRLRFGIPDAQPIHFDIPLTIEHEKKLLLQAGFTNITFPACLNGAAFVYAL